MQELIERFYQYAGGVWHRRWSVLGIAWVVCVTGWVAVGLMPNRYTSEARLYIDTQTILGPLMQGIAVTPDIERQVEMMRRTLLSRPNVQELIRMTDLDYDVSSELELENLVDRMIRQVGVSVEANDLFKVSYTDTDREMAYRVVDAILQIFVEQNLGHTQKDVENARQFIDRRIEEYEEELREAELRVAEFRREHGEELSGNDRGVRELEVAQSSLRLLQSEMEAALWRRDQLNLELAKIPARIAAGEAGLAQLSPLELKLKTLNDQLNQDLLVYTERHPKVVALRAQIAQLEAALLSQGGTSGSPSGVRTVANPVHQQLADSLRGLEGTIDNLRRRISLSEDEISRLAETVAAAPQVQADLRRLTRDYDVLAEQHTALVQRRESAQLAQRLDMDTSTVDFRIVDPPTRPIKASGPPHGILMAGVLVAGLAAGVGLALVRVLLGTTFTTEADLRDALRLPILGSIASAPTGLAPRFSLVKHFAFGGAVAGLLACFVIVFYFYQLAPAKPDLAALALDLQQQAEGRFSGPL